MKATGIVRRIDDLGRVVIPREIRKACHIREGDPLEIFTEGDAVVFKPYIPYLEPWRLLEDVVDAIERNGELGEYRAEIRDLACRMKKSANR